LPIGLVTEERQLMRAYFFANKPGPPEESGSGTVSFHLPELNITFRARYRGTAVACEYAALLALLEFVDINPKLFKGRALELYGDSFAVVNQVNDRQFCKKDLLPFRNMALIYKKKIPYSIEWVPPTDIPSKPRADAEI